MTPHGRLLILAASFLFISCGSKSEGRAALSTNAVPIAPVGQAMPKSAEEPVPPVRPTFTVDNTNVEVVKTAFQNGLWRVTVKARGQSNLTVVSFDGERFGGNHRVGNQAFRYRIRWSE